MKPPCASQLAPNAPWLPESGLPEHAWLKLQQVFENTPQVQRVTLFGSRAQGKHRAGSDIDLCVRAPGMAAHELWVLDAAIDDLLLPWKVDLLLEHTIDHVELLDHIRRVGRPFYVRHAPGL
ncbi:nucleotidyltransferase family protein [Tepidicella baoligensis]|uniref:nucleotidyltransferase family protein n=1 Tax=Tepidicella baoligensis TaxID=2707016 RepID=UPI0015DBB896